MKKRSSILFLLLALLLFILIPQQVNAKAKDDPTRIIQADSFRLAPAQIDLNEVATISDGSTATIQIEAIENKLLATRVRQTPTLPFLYLEMYIVTNPANPIKTAEVNLGPYVSSAPPHFTLTDTHVYVARQNRVNVFEYFTGTALTSVGLGAGTLIDGDGILTMDATENNLYIATRHDNGTACYEFRVGEFSISDPANLSGTPDVEISTPDGAYSPAPCPTVYGEPVQIVAGEPLVNVFTTGLNTRFGRVPQGMWVLNATGNALLPLTLRDIDEPTNAHLDENGLLHITNNSRGPDVVWYPSELQTLLAANFTGDPVKETRYLCGPTYEFVECNPGTVEDVFGDVVAENNIIYVESSTGLRVFDANGTTPIEIANTTLGDNSSQLAIANDILYMTDASGVIRIYSTAPPSSANLIANPSFEDGLSQWEDFGNNTISSDATGGSQAVCTGTGAGGAGQNVPVTAGTTYRFSGQAKVSNGDKATVGMQFFDANFTTVGRPVVNVTSSSYAPFAVEMMAPPGSAVVKVWTFKDAGDGLMCFDEMSLSGGGGSTGGGEPASCTTSRGLLHETFSNIDGNKLSSLLAAPSYPNSPTASDTITNFEIPANVADRYGTRVQGYLTPPETGTYTFWIASDDEGQLSLSSDESVANAVEIARVPEWTPSQTWDWYAEQQSAEISLEAGQTYYVEALMKENFGGDNLAVAWRVPSSAGNVMPELIPNDYLCTFEQDGFAPNAGFVASSYNASAPANITFDASGSFDPDGNIVSYEWDFGDGTTGSGVTVDKTYPVVRNYSVTLTVTDNDGNSSTDTQIISVTSISDSDCTTNGVLWERWDDVEGTWVNGALLGDPRYPDNPSDAIILTDVFETPSYIGENYGSRLRAILVPPVSGSYTFWIAADDDGQLLLSSDDSAANAVEIAAMPRQGWAAPRQFGWYAEQQSAEIELVAGEAYYIEARHKEAFGGDNLAIAWSGAVGPRTVIAAEHLCPLDNGVTTTNLLARSNSPVITHTPVSNTALATIMPDELRNELVSILILNADIRAQLFGLHTHLDLLLSTNGVVTDEFITDATNAYNALYGASSPELQTWLADTWAMIDIDQYAGDSAETAWYEANRSAMPNVVFLPILD